MKWLIRRDGEVILGMATIGSHIDPNFSVCVNPDAHRVGTCYFKYYNSESYTTADKVVRMNIRKPEVVIHRNRDGKKHWVLNSREKRAICDYLREPTRFDYRHKATNWEYLLYTWNIECQLLGDFPSDSYDTPFEAFVDGWYDTDENLSNPSYVASNLPIPDYTQIPQGK